MRFAILDACFPVHKQAGRGMAAEYLAWELRRNGTREYPPAEADAILITCTSPIDCDYVRRIKTKYPHKAIVVGGAGSTSPYSLGLHGDVVCVGDGQIFMRILIHEGLEAARALPNAWVHGETRPVEIDQGFPWDCPPIMAEDGAVRVWCGRGCKNKCAFCQTGWAHTYAENPDPERLLAQIRRLRAAGQKVNYLSNDLAQHSFFKRLPPVEHGSYSVKYLREYGLPPARQVRLGIEGVSERLRNLVNKPISHDDLVKCTAWLNANGRGVRWFLIAGLPGETADDWEELKAAVMRWKEITPKGVLALSFTAWCPDPATPLAIMPLRDDYWENFLRFKEWFFGGIGWSNRVKLMSPQQPKARLAKAIAAMGLTEKQLRDGGNWGPNDRVNYPYKTAAKKLAESIARRAICGDSSGDSRSE